MDKSLHLKVCGLRMSKWMSTFLSGKSFRGSKNSFIDRPSMDRSLHVQCGGYEGGEDENMVEENVDMSLNLKSQGQWQVSEYVD